MHRSTAQPATPIFNVLTALLFAWTLAFTPSAWAAEAEIFGESFGDYREDLENASSGNKAALVLMFTQESCPFCAKMHERVLPENEVKAFYSKHFLSFEHDIYGSREVVDFDGKDSNEKKFALKYRARLTPVFIFFGKDGKELTRYTGFADKETFLMLGEFVTSGAYKTDNFISYKRKQGK